LQIFVRYAILIQRILFKINILANQKSCQYSHDSTEGILVLSKEHSKAFILLFKIVMGEVLTFLQSFIAYYAFSCKSYSPFCVTAKVIKLVGLKNGGRVSPTNLITFAVTQNGKYMF
jgi:hypothetical protein